MTQHSPESEYKPQNRNFEPIMHSKKGLNFLFLENVGIKPWGAGLSRDEIDYSSLFVVPALPSSAHLPEGGEEIFARLKGAKILAIGGFADYGIEGGGLIVDFMPDGVEDSECVVFAFNENGMWVEFGGRL